MDFLKKIVLIFASTVFTYSLGAQNVVAGRVLEGNDSKPVEYASVVLKNMEDKVIAGVVTDKHGVYKFKVSQTGEHILQISFIGYKTINAMINIEPGVNAIKTPVFISQNSAELDGVTVTATRNERQSSVEKTRINTSAAIASATGSVTEILKTSSMVTVDNNNAVYIRGNSNVLVLIDGVPTTLGALDGLPASATESIEIITNPDAKYDSEGTGGIINVITKKKGAEGFSLSSSLNWGVHERVNGDLMATINKNGWNLALNYSGKYHLEDVRSGLSRYFYSTGNSIEQDIFSEREDVNNMLSANISRLMKNNDRVSFNIKFANPKLTNNQTLYVLSSSLDNYDASTRNNEFIHDRRMLELSADYKKVIKPKVSEITLKGTFSQNRGQRFSFYEEDGEISQKSQGGGYPKNMTLQADHFVKFAKERLLESGLKFFYRGNDFKFETFDHNIQNGEWELNVFFSSDLYYQENIYSAYTNYGGGLGNGYSYKAGIRVEYSESELNIRKENERIEKYHFFPAPFLMFSKRLSDISNLDLVFSRRVTRPVYPQINPFVNMVDKSVYETGNRDLVPEEVSQAEVAYNYTKNGTSFMASLFLSHTGNFITQVSSLYDNDALMLTYVNGQKALKAGLDLNVRKKLTGFLTGSLSANGYFGETHGNESGMDLYTNKFMWSGNLSAMVNPTPKDNISIQYFYNSPTVFPQFEAEQVHYMNASYKRELIKNILTASVTLTDVFNTREWNIVSDNSVYSLDNNSKNESRILWIGLTFNLNKREVGGSGKKQSQEEPESLIKLGY
jgi:outer membrane receptor protein involved in Fe transport